MGRISMRLDIYPPPALREEIDRWRAEQPGLPPAAQAVRMLIELGLQASAEAKAAINRDNEVKKRRSR